MLMAVLGAALYISARGLLNPTFAALLGTILGYFYGRGYGGGGR